jgi:hypothetical protein
MLFHIKAASRGCCPRVQTVALCFHVIAIIGLRPDGVALSSGWMQSVCTQVPYQGSRRPDGVVLTSERAQAVFPLHVWEGKLESSRTMKCVRTCCHDVRTDASLKLFDIDGRPDAWLGRLDGNMGSDFSELEYAQNFPWALEIAFQKFFWRLWKTRHTWLWKQHYMIVILASFCVWTKSLMCKDSVNKDSTCQSIFRRLCTAKKIEDLCFNVSRPDDVSSHPDDVFIPTWRQTDQHHPSGWRVFSVRTLHCIEKLLFQLPSVRTS